MSINGTQTQFLFALGLKMLKDYYWCVATFAIGLLSFTCGLEPGVPGKAWTPQEVNAIRLKLRKIWDNDVAITQLFDPNNDGTMEGKNSTMFQSLEKLG